MLDTLSTHYRPRRVFDGRGTSESLPESGKSLWIDFEEGKEGTEITFRQEEDVRIGDLIVIPNR